VEQKTQQKHALAIRVFVQLGIVSNSKHKHNLSTKHGLLRLLDTFMHTLCVNQLVHQVEMQLSFNLCFAPT